MFITIYTLLLSRPPSDKDDDEQRNEEEKDHAGTDNPNPIVRKMDRPEKAALGWKFISCSHIKNCVNLLFWLLIGCSLLCSQSGASLLVDQTVVHDCNYKFPSLVAL